MLRRPPRSPPFPTSPLSRSALDIENSGIVLSPLIPWNISVSIPLAMLGADMSAIPYEILLYAIPLCYWLTKRRVYPPKGDDCYDTIAEPLAHS